MGIPIIGDIIEEVGSTIRHVVKDPNQAAEIESALKTKMLEGKTAENLAQAKINEQDAKSDDKFQSRWRPSIGWICSISIAHEFIIFPWFTAIMRATGQTDFELPNIPFAELSVVLMGMLGISGSRTWEKFRGVAGKFRK